MKTIPRLSLSLLGALALPIIALAQATDPRTPTTDPRSPTTTTTTNPITTPTTTTAPVDPRGSPTATPTPATRVTAFATFETASPAVKTAVTSATAGAAMTLEEALRLGIAVPATKATIPATTVGPAGSPGSPATPALPNPALTTAVVQATTAIVNEDRTARAGPLTERESAITRMRGSQTEQDRQRAIGELRDRSGQRLDEQREAARLVRDRLRQLRDNTTLTRASGT